MDSSDYYIQDNSGIEQVQLDAAKNLYQSGDYDGALKLYLNMLSLSMSYKLYYEAGRCYYKLNDLEKAEEYFKSSIAIIDSNNPSYLYLGNIASKKQDITNAIKYWIISYSNKPYDESLCLNLASAYFTKGMKFYAIYYYQKYLKYAKDKDSLTYKEIKSGLDRFKQNSHELYQKAKRAVALKDYNTAIDGLEQALTKFPLNFDMNYLLGKLYYDKKNYNSAITYLKQALCIDNKSIDVLQILSATTLNSELYTDAYCYFKRMIPLVIGHQKEYLELIRTIKKLEPQINTDEISRHELIAEEYYNNNDYKNALFEYETCLILNPNLSHKYENIIENLKVFIAPEADLIKMYMEQASVWHSAGNIQKANKYFSKILILAETGSPEYKIAKSRLTNV
ncbi:MAG: tetratricopeptide repeat protein [bacterium]|nr:tetratricopeptide repeat protein [bacterium]